MSELKDLENWIRENKLAAAIVAIVVLLVAGGIFSIFQASFGYMGAAPQGARQELEKSLAPTQDYGGSEGGEYVEVKEANLDIKTEDAERDSGKITDLTGAYGGYVQERRKETTNLYRRIHLVVRIPRNNFTDYIEYLRNNYEVESYSVKNYRIGIQRELDELEILNNTLQRYEQYREEIKEMELGKKKLDLLMQITEKELEIKEKMKHYQRELGEKRKMAKYSTVRITLEERRVVDIAPENIGNRFNQRVKEMLDNIVTTLIN
ncbi:MAG: DUF4349 domain-containing protein, partial [Candidatus Aenigmatarchaeota archaeon]